MAWDFLHILQDDTLSCDQKLDEIQDLIQEIGHPPHGSLYHVSDIFEDCVNQEHMKCLETAYLIAEVGEFEVSGFLYTDIGRGLEAIGQTDINAVNQFIKQQIRSRDFETAHNLSTLVPRLYRGQVNEMAVQMPEWYNTYSYFFFRALKNTFIAFLEDRDSKRDFDSELQIIKSKLDEIAKTESVKPVDAYEGRNKHDLLLKVSLLLDDLEWASKNNVDYGNIERNLDNYPFLEEVLNENDSAIKDLSGHNTHPLTQLLQYDHSPQQARSILNDEDSSPEERRDAKDSLKQIQKLTYYNYCLEKVVDDGPGHDPIGTLRKHLLGRTQYHSTVAELESINVLRREFGPCNVEIEKSAPNGKEPDVHITTPNHTIWGDVTIPRPQVSYQIARRYSMKTNPQDTRISEKTHIQKKILDKVEGQLGSVKEDTSDLTMLILKKEDSKVDNDTFRNYILGRLGLAISKNDSGAEPVVVRGETGIEFDNIADHLDIIILFDTLNDLSSSPYIEGQVANLTDVDQNIIDQLLNAFNADELKPPRP